MSFLWFPHPKDRNQDGFRKHYKDGQKVSHGFPYFITAEPVQDTSPEGTVKTLKRVWSDNLNCAHALFGPRPFDELKELVCPKGNPLLNVTGDGFRRTNISLAGEMVDRITFDLDGEHHLISCASGLSDRDDVIGSLLPFPLASLERVAFFSSSAFFKDEAKPNRINVHYIVWLDKPYPRETVRAFLLKFKEHLDPALGVKTQPHIIANPKFENTDKFTPPGERIIHFSGDRLCLDAFDLRADGPKTSPQQISISKTLSRNSEEKARQIEEMALSGELDGIRNGLLYREIWREFFFNSTEEGWGFVERLNKPHIVTGKDGRVHDVYEMADKAQFHIRQKITGQEFSGANPHQKIISEIDLANYDNSELPRKNSVITLKSGCGTGKTKHFIKDYWNDFKRCLYITQLKATAEPTAKELGEGTHYYLEESDGVSADTEFMRSADKLVTTDKSIHKLFDKDGCFKRYELVVIDECERVAMNSLDVTSRQHEILEAAMAADCVLLADADLSDDLGLWFAKEIADKSTEFKELCSVVNTADWMGEGHHCYQLNEETDVYGITEKLLSQNKRVYLHCGFSDFSEEHRISAIARVFRAKFPDKKILGCDAKTAPRELREQANKYLDREKIDLLIVSPWSKVGWDYNGKLPFDATVGTYPGQIITAPDIAQQMRRPRLTKLHYVWVGPRPKNAEKRLEDLEDSWGKHPEIRQMEKTTPFLLAERARRKRAREEANIARHLRLLLEERECKFHHGFSTDAKKEEWQGLLTVEGKKTEEEIINALWNDATERDYLLANFYSVGPLLRYDKHDNLDDVFNSVYPFKEEFKEWIVASTNNETLRYNEAEISKEDFAALYRRDLNVKEKDIGKIAKVWFLDHWDRGLLDEKDQIWFASITGDLLDAVDELVCREIGSPDKFIDFVMDDTEEELAVLYDAKRFKEKIISLFEHSGGRYAEWIPWMNSEGGVKKNFKQFFRAMAEFFDLHFEVHQPLDGEHKPTFKLNAIRDGENQNLFPRSRAKKMRNVTEKIAIVEANIDEKRAKKQKLTDAEMDWMRHRSDALLVFRKHNYRNKSVIQAASRFR